MLGWATRIAAEISVCAEVSPFIPLVALPRPSRGPMRRVFSRQDENRQRDSSAVDDYEQRGPERTDRPSPAEAGLVRLVRGLCVSTFAELRAPS